MNSLRVVGEHHLPLASLLCHHVPGSWPSSRSVLQQKQGRAHSGEVAHTKSHLTDYKRGRGGRSSFSGVVATVFGATGFLGGRVVNQLGKIGSQVIVPYRGDISQVRELKLMGDLGQILFLEYHLDDDEAIRKAVQHSNVVINLVGKFNETSNFPFERVHVEAAGRLARICKEVGVETLLHVSALNCAKTPTPYILKPGGSQFLQSKFLGEEAVRREFPEAIIFRPSYMFGQNDHFMFYFTRKQRIHRMPGYSFLPLWRRGKETAKQPVYVVDVAKAIAKAIGDPDCRGQTYQAVGPHRYRLDEITRWLFHHLRYNSSTFGITGMDPVIKLRAVLHGIFKPVYPRSGLERMEFECHTDVVDPNLPTLEDLGISLTKLEDRILWEMRPYRKYNYYNAGLGELLPPPNPPLATF